MHTQPTTSVGLPERLRAEQAGGTDVSADQSWILFKHGPDVPTQNQSSPRVLVSPRDLLLQHMVDHYDWLLLSLHISIAQFCLLVMTVTVAIGNIWISQYTSIVKTLDEAEHAMQNQHSYISLPHRDIIGRTWTHELRELVLPFADGNRLHIIFLKFCRPA